MEHFVGVGVGELALVFCLRLGHFLGDTLTFTFAYAVSMATICLGVQGCLLFIFLIIYKLCRILSKVFGIGENKGLIYTLSETGFVFS